MKRLQSEMAYVEHRVHLQKYLDAANRNEAEDIEPLIDNYCTMTSKEDTKTDGSPDPPAAFGYRVARCAAGEYHCLWAIG